MKGTEYQSTNTLTKKSKYNWKELLLIVGVMIVTALIVGSVTNYLVNKQANNEKVASNKKISNLSSQLNDLEKEKEDKDANASTLTNDQIFQEASEQLNLTRNDIVYFRIFGQDKIQYSEKSSDAGANFAYKTNGTWKIAQSHAQSAAQCGDLENVPQDYRPPCLDSNNNILYQNSDNTSTNYPPASGVAFIGD